MLIVQAGCSLYHSFHFCFKYFKSWESHHKLKSNVGHQTFRQYLQCEGSLETERIKRDSFSHTMLTVGV